MWSSAVALRTAASVAAVDSFSLRGAARSNAPRRPGLQLIETYYAPALIEWPEEPVSERVLAKMAYRADPRAWSRSSRRPVRRCPETGTLFVVAVGIEKPGNLGAIARSAEAAGADALLVAEARADPFNPNAIRASTGAVFTLPIVETRSSRCSALGV